MPSSWRMIIFPDLPPEDDASVDLGGGSLEKVGVYPTKLGQGSGFAETGLSNFGEDLKVSRS